MSERKRTADNKKYFEDLLRDFEKKMYVEETDEMKKLETTQEINLESPNAREVVKESLDRYNRYMENIDFENYRSIEKLIKYYLKYKLTFKQRFYIMKAIDDMVLSGVEKEEKQEQEEIKRRLIKPKSAKKQKK
jgi:amino acid permease